MQDTRIILKNREKTATKDRYIEFDFLKFFAIFLVIWGHGIMHLSDADKNSNFLYQFIYSFHMPLFMMMAGYFSKNSLTLPFKTIIKKKFRQLIYPCLTFGILFFILEIVAYQKDYREFYHYLYEGFWFLKSCFLCYLVLYICIKTLRNNQNAGIILALIISQALPFFKLTWMLPFFVFGLILNCNWDYFFRNKKFIFIVGSILYIITFYIYLSLPPIDLKNIKGELLNSNYEFVSDYIRYHLTRLIVGVAGSIAFLSAIILIASKIRNNKLLLYFSNYGRFTLEIYILQTLILEIILSRSINLGGINQYLFNFLIIPSISFMVLFICFLIINLINKKPIIRQLLWGN